jgi:Amt family ammonium transporter
MFFKKSLAVLTTAAVLLAAAVFSSNSLNAQNAEAPKAEAKSAEAKNSHVPTTQNAPAASAQVLQRLEALEAAFANAPRPAAPAAGTAAAGTAASAGSTAGSPAPAHNGWMMTATALVLFMTLPGLALFYGGLVRRKNVLSVLAQCFGIAAVATILWWAVGFSLVVSAGSIIGGCDYAFLRGVTANVSGNFPFPWVSDNVFAMYQLTFAIITPALTVGAIAERMKFSAILLFTVLWLFVVYYPFAHMLWGGGWIATQLGALDFAGGLVVHISSGYTALALCLLLGKRIGYGVEKMAPHSMVLCAVGTAILWVGWYGFNAGSAGAADTVAANAFTSTTLAAAVAAAVWAALEYITRRRPSVLGICSGAIAGLALVTPAAGYIDATGGVICGVVAGVVPFFFCVKVKQWLGYDDALDTFGVHAVGGTLGILLTGVLAQKHINPAALENTKTLLDDGSLALLGSQTAAAIIAIAWSVGATVVLALLVKKLCGNTLRPSTENERIGLDISDHGEEGYTE